MVTFKGLPEILAVASNRRNLDLLAQFLEPAGYATRKISSLEELDVVLASPIGCVLSLIDLSGFDQQVWERCEQLRKRGIPFLLISPRQSAALQQEGLSRGARGVLVKPLQVRELIRLIGALRAD